MKSYQLEPTPLCEVDGGALLGWYSKGHHAPDEFATACRSEFGDIHEEELVETQMTPEHVAHEHWRNVPYDKTGMIMVEAKQGTPGAYPVTVIRL